MCQYNGMNKTLKIILNLSMVSEREIVAACKQWIIVDF